MIVFLLVIQSSDKGIGLDKLPIATSDDPSELAFAGCMDLALKVAGEHIQRECGMGHTVEGKNIEELVGRTMKEMNFLDIRKHLKEAGFVFPDERKS